MSDPVDLTGLGNSREGMEILCEGWAKAKW